MTRPRLRILYVGTLPPHNGGSAIQSANVLVGLARGGHRVRAIGQTTPSALVDGDAFALRHPELDVVRMTVPYFDGSPDVPSDDDYREQEGSQIERLVPGLLASEPADVIVLGRESFAWHVPRFRPSVDVPLVLLAQGATTAGLVNGSYPPDEAATLLDRLRLVSHVIAPAPHVRSALGDFGIDCVDVIDNCVDLSLFRPAPPDPLLRRDLGLTPDDVVVLHPSNLKPLKRPLDLVESSAIALREEPRLAYVVAGDGPLRTATEEAAVRTGVADRFRFVPWVEHERMPDYFNAADLVAMPSAAEAQALVYLETQACGRALLASDIAAAREIAADGETGILHRVGDIRDLAAKTVLVARDPELRGAIGRRARQRVERHALPRVVRAYERLLLEVVDGAVAAV